ncbi:MAG: ABC transporter permease [Clostridiales bacterium]|nr:ABC transporter permease [Clostridiales bacterium]
MKELKTRISLLPVHAVVMCITAILSLFAIFIPMFELFVQYRKQKVYSLFSLILDPDVNVVLREGQVNLDFKMFGAWMFTATIIISVAAMTLALGFQLYSDNAVKKRLGCLSVMVLFILRLFAHIYTLSNFVTDKMIAENNMTSQRLYVVQTLTGNILAILLVIGIFACIYGALGLKMSMKLLAYPYILWIVVFTILPLALILFRAFFAKTTGGYTFTTDGFATLFANKTVTTSFYGMKVTLQEYFSVFVRSLDYAVWTTIGCLIISYPLAYIMAERTKRLHKTSSKLLLLLVLPMWMNTMLRTYAWRAFFGETGVLNTILQSAGAISEPILFLQNPVLSDIITKLVMVNDFLPFMILPIYSVLVKIDSSLSQAAEDLGANKVQTFLKVIFPLSLPGVISGIQMVFMPSMTFYMIPDIISEGSKTTIGNTVQSFILNESTTYQQAGNVLSLILLIFVLITMGVLRNQDKEASGSGGMVL